MSTVDMTGVKAIRCTVDTVLTVSDGAGSSTTTTIKAYSPEGLSDWHFKSPQNGIITVDSVTPIQCHLGGRRGSRGEFLQVFTVDEMRTPS